MRLLVNCNCVVSEAAKLAGVNRTYLYKQMKRYKVSNVKLARELLANGSDTIVKEKVRRSLQRKITKPDWDRPLPGYTPYQSKQKNNNVRN
jgi:hypothetical protein